MELVEKVLEIYQAQLHNGSVFSSINKNDKLGIWHSLCSNKSIKCTSYTVYYSHDINMMRPHRGQNVITV